LASEPGATSGENERSRTELARLIGLKLKLAENAAAELNAKLSLGLASKRKAESWEQFEDRVIQMFRDKGLFKNDHPS
jgi:hypothetical protein